MRIGIDIDGVLFPWADAANEALMQRFGLPDPGPHRAWEYLKDSVHPDQWAWLWSQEGSDAVFSQVERTYPGVVDVVTWLLSRHECHFVTHRSPQRTALHTAAFLRHHFGRKPWAGMHLITNATRKAGVLAWDVFIDDKPATVHDFLATTNAQVFAPVRPWNMELADVLWPAFCHYHEPCEIVQWLGR